MNNKVGNYLKSFIKHKIKMALLNIFKKMLRSLFMAVKKLLMGFISAVGLPVVVILLFVVLVGGIIYFVWAENNKEIEVQYQEASEKSAALEEYRVPVWLIKSIDSVSMIKEGREIGSIKPKEIVLGLESIITTGVVGDSRVREYTISNSGTTLKSDKPNLKDTKRVAIQKVIMWDKIITFEYEIFANKAEVRTTSSTSGSESSGGYSSYKRIESNYEWQPSRIYSESDAHQLVTHYEYVNNNISYREESTSTPLLAKDAPETSGMVSSYLKVNTVGLKNVTNNNDNVEGLLIYNEQYNYETSSRTYNNSYLSELSTFSGEASSTKGGKITETEQVLLVKKTIEYDYSRLTERLLNLNYKQSDIDLLLEAIRVHSPGNPILDDYDTSVFENDDFSWMLGGGSGGFGDAPHIPNAAGWVFPTDTDARVSSAYGYRIHPIKNTRKLHKGVDIARSNHSLDYPLYAVFEGTVQRTSFDANGYGYQVLIDHGDGIVTRYAHMKKGSVAVKKGDKITTGQFLGIMGATGSATGIHLHFEVLVDGTAVNPIGYISK